MQEKKLAQEALKGIIVRTRSGELIWQQSDDDTYYAQLGDFALHLTTGRERSEASARRGKQIVFLFTHRNRDDQRELSQLQRAVRIAGDARVAALREMNCCMGIQTEDRPAPTTAASDDAGSDDAATTETASDDAPLVDGHHCIDG